MKPTELFERSRERLIAVAYRMLGTMADAEDVVQDVFERWLSVDAASVDNPDAYLTTMTTRRAIDRLGSAQKRREVYTGPWLPEPILTSNDPAEVAELDESVTIGYLYLLEQLSPIQRAVHLLHEVFDYSYGEIATMVDKDEANCRQISARARKRLTAAGEPTMARVSPEREAGHVAALVGAVMGGDVEQVKAILTDDVVHLSDGGEHVRAARHPIIGPDRVARLLTNLARRAQAHEGEVELEMVRANGQPAVLLILDGHPMTLTILEAVEDGIRRIHAVVNPQKLERVMAEVRSGSALPASTLEGDEQLP